MNNLDNIKNKVYDDLKNIKDSTQELGKDVKDNAPIIASAAFDKAKFTAKDAGTTAMEWISDHPIKSLTIAFGAGWLCSRRKAKKYS